MIETILLTKSIKNAMLVFLVVNIVYMVFNKEKEKRIKYVLIQACIFLSLIIFFLMHVKLSGRPYILVHAQFIYEIIGWIMIGITILHNRIKGTEEQERKHGLTAIEKLIVVLSMAVGLAYILFLATNNYRYILPQNEYGTIGNVYFNADVHRGAYQLISEGLTDPIHPLYRFSVLPIYIFFIILERITHIYSMSNIFIYNTWGYFVVCIQVLLNTISAVTVYRILRKMDIHNRVSVVITVMFILSLTFMWLSIVPETYSITLCMILLAIYRYLRKDNRWCIYGTVAAGTNLAAMLPIGMLLMIEVIMKHKAKLKNMRKSIMIGIAIGLSFIIVMVGYKLFETYIIQWTDQSVADIARRVSVSVNKFIIPMLMGPQFIHNVPFFVEANRASILSVGIFLGFAIIALIGYIANARRNWLANVCVIQLISGLILHVVIGYGIHSGILYTALYHWAFLILIALGVDELYKRKSCLVMSITAALVIMMAANNVMWLAQLGTNIHEVEFKQQIYQAVNREYNLSYSDGSTENLFINNRKIILVSTGETIVDRVDAEVCYHQKENYITGNILGDGKWFKLYIEDDILKLNVNETVKEIHKHPYYIFGMGTRNKYLFTQENGRNTYQLIESEKKKVIASHISLEKMDYENYTILARNENNETIKIFENEKGIYIQTGDKLVCLDESSSIHIPDFAGYAHEKQLKKLFNEIMVNISANPIEGVKPNVFAYSGAWYRDGAMAAMALKRTNNLKQVQPFINSIEKLYDEENGEKEADNLGELLYILSLSEKKNDLLINKVINEAKRITNKDGYIEGRTDGGDHPAYATGWLIYGLNSLGRDTSSWKMPDIEDSYRPLLWFMEKENNTKVNQYNIPYDYQYLYYAKLHYYGMKVDNHNVYPMSFESDGLMAQFDEMKKINDNYQENRMVVPHVWSAAEMFLYYLDWDEGKL